jgi:hypothetical protein
MRILLELPELRDPRRARPLLSCHVMHLCANLSDVLSSFRSRSFLVLCNVS